MGWFSKKKWAAADWPLPPLTPPSPQTPQGLAGRRLRPQLHAAPVGASELRRREEVGALLRRDQQRRAFGQTAAGGRSHGQPGPCQMSAGGLCVCVTGMMILNRGHEIINLRARIILLCSRDNKYMLIHYYIVPTRKLLHSHKWLYCAHEII